MRNRTNHKNTDQINSSNKHLYINLLQRIVQIESLTFDLHKTFAKSHKQRFKGWLKCYQFHIFYYFLKKSIPKSEFRNPN